MATGTQTGKAFPVRLVVAGLAILALLILVVQNGHTVSFDVFFWDIEGRLIWMLLTVGVLGFLAGLITPRFHE